MSENNNQAERDPWARYDRDPAFPPPESFDGYDVRILDPGSGLAAPGVSPRPTAYVRTRLLVSTDGDAGGVLDYLKPVASSLGMDAEFEEDDEAASAAAVRCVGLAVSESAGRSATAGQPVPVVDSWALLQAARTAARADDFDLSGVGLEHVLFASPVGIGLNPYRATPYRATPYRATPYRATGDAAATYGVPGSGGRQPLAFLGPRPRRKAVFEPRRPVVGTVDTGCGAHPWLDEAVRTDEDLKLDGIGYKDASSDPEVYGDQVGPLDGEIDPLAGHGTFIAGLIHQACPDADITPWRVVELTRPIVESDLIDALRRIADRVEAAWDDAESGYPLDVLNVSMGYYHETPEDVGFDLPLRAVLRRLTSLGVTVVCSAGNDATARKMFPAAWAPGTDDDPNARDRAPLISVGATNPNGQTDALFSNTGPWVQVYAEGAAVVSTVPSFRGGLLPMARTEVVGRTRESIDPDDFRGGFAAWSGTSFAAPIVSGRIAKGLARTLLADGAPASARMSAARAWDVVEDLYGITP